MLEALFDGSACLQTCGHYSVTCKPIPKILFPN